MKPSYYSSMTSQLVAIIAWAIVLMQLWNFYKTGQVMDIFNSLASMVLGAYFKSSLDNKWSNENSKSSWTNVSEKE